MKLKPILPRPDASTAAEAMRTIATRLVEAGQRLKAAKLERLQAAANAIAVAERPMAEAWSASAWDASCGADMLSDLVSLMGEESDEPEQFALLRTAFDALNQWISAEVSEIGQATDDETSSGVALFDYEAIRAAAKAEELQPVQESVIGDPIPLREGAVRSDGTVRLKVIQPGWSSNGRYYPQEVLERDGPAVFQAGTKTYWDHPTLTEETDRPERSLRDLAGQITSDVEWESDGPEGPGLYADAEVISEFAAPVNELAPFIGVSIRALGTGHTGTAEGRSGTLIDKLIAGESIDYVTTPGAGGRVLQIFEAARRREPISPKEVDTDDMDALKEAEGRLKAKDDELKAQATELTQLRESTARQAEQIFLGEARRSVAAKLAEHDGIPEVTRQRLEEALTRMAKPSAEGKVDDVAITAAVEAAVKAEAEYLAKATGGGRVVGFGESAKSSDDHEKQLQEILQSPGFGLSEATAKLAARGRG